MTDAEIEFATAWQHFKCLGWLHSEKCLWPEGDDDD